MKVEFLKKGAISLGLMNKGAVVESEAPGVIDEFKALIKVGYAKETNKAVGTGREEKAQVKFYANKSVRPSKQGLRMDAPVVAFDTAAILSGTVGEVTEALDGLSAAQLSALDEAELQGKDRAGVHSAIADAKAALEAE